MSGSDDLSSYWAGRYGLQLAPEKEDFFGEPDLRVDSFRMADAKSGAVAVAP